MTVVEICSGTAPAARACSILGLNSISFDFREEQNETTVSPLNQFIDQFTSMFDFYIKIKLIK